MNDSTYFSKPVAYAIETTPGISNIFSDSETLANMVGVYEECGYAVYPTLIAQEADGQFSVIIESIRVHASANELLSLDDFFYYRGKGDVIVWSWHLVPGTGKHKGQFVWRFPKGQDTNLNGPILSIHCKDSTDVYLFGTPDDMEHAWEAYRSLGKIPVRTDYTGENISCMMISVGDVTSLRALMAEKGHAKLLSTLEYEEYHEIFESTGDSRYQDPNCGNI